MLKMYSFMFVILSLTVIRSSSVVKRQAADLDPDAFLSKFGYLDDLEPGRNYAEETRSEGIREFQVFNGLNPTGLMNRETFLKMQQPRCGLPDVIKPRDRQNGNRLRSRHDPTQPLPFYAPGYKWDKNDITYKIMGYTRQLGGSIQKLAFRNAFGKWSAETPLNFREVSGGADIEISFARSSHGDGNGNAFDGRGGTLAHAFFPGTQPISGDTHFDEDEEWTMNRDAGSNLEIVAAHEFGHALGLGHSNNPRALMAPYYQGYDPNYKLDYDDKRGIQTLYGARRSGRQTPRPTVRPRPRPTARPRPRPTARPRPRPTARPRPRPTARPRPRPTRRPRPRPTPRPTGRHCRVKFDDITVAHDRQTYGFRGSKIYRLDAGGVASGFPKPVRRVFARAPKTPSAVVYDRSQRKLYMFKGSKYWRYTGYSLDRGYPRTLPSAFRRLKAAFQYSDGRIYLFKFNTYTLWTEGMRTAPRGYERSITQNWSGIKPGMEAIFRDTDGTFYFFKGKVYWKYDDNFNYAEPGYPKKTSQAWLGCNPRIPR